MHIPQTIKINSILAVFDWKRGFKPISTRGPAIVKAKIIPSWETKEMVDQTLPPKDGGIFVRIRTSIAVLIKGRDRKNINPARQI